VCHSFAFSSVTAAFLSCSTHSPIRATNPPISSCVFAECTQIRTLSFPLGTVGYTIGLTRYNPSCKYFASNLGFGVSTETMGVLF